MYDEIIKDMDGAYSINESNDDVTRAVQKYFPSGMDMEEAYKLLRQLEGRGFEVREYRHEGARKWPDGELVAYRDEASRRAYEPQDATIHYTASKRYESRIGIFEKHALITIFTNGIIIVRSKGQVVHRTNLP